MNRKFVQIAIFVLAGIGAFFPSCAKSDDHSLSGASSPFTQTRPTPKEITIRNVTKEAVTFTLVPSGSKDKPVAKTLAVGAIDRVATSQTLVIAYQKYGREITYSLYPGKPYSFRYDSSGQIDIWVGSHGREDAEDLAPWVPTPPEVIAKMLEMAKADKNAIMGHEH